MAIVLVGEKVVGRVDGVVEVNGKTITGSKVLNPWIEQANKAHQPLSLLSEPGGFSVIVYEGGVNGGVTTTLKDRQMIYPPIVAKL